MAHARSVLMILNRARSVTGRYRAGRWPGAGRPTDRRTYGAFIIQSIFLHVQRGLRGRRTCLSPRSRPYAFKGDPLNFGPRPPGRPTPKKVFPKFSKILRAVGDKILATVPWPTSSEKNSEISPKIDDISSYAKIPIQKIPKCAPPSPL